MFDNADLDDHHDRFRAVDSVAEHIFETMPALSDAYDSTDPSLWPDAGARESDGSKTSETFFKKTERVVGALVQALEDRNKALQDASLERADKPTGAFQEDISYYAARRRSQLPDGVELLQGEPNHPSEDELLSSIRAVIDEQEAEQYAVKIEQKRKQNRRSLPMLEPQHALVETPQTPVQPVKSPTAPRRARAALRQAFRKDFFLASALSVWSALALAVYIDPSVSGILFGTSMFLLFVASCLFPDSKDIDLGREHNAVRQAA